MSIALTFGPEAAAIGRHLAAWRSDRVATRLLARDATLWTDAGIADTPGDPIANRLGWLDLPVRSPAALPAWRRMAADVAAEGVQHVVLLGMGGSSLGAAMLVRCLPRTDGSPELVVADSTHPAFVRALDATVDPARALVIAASKSGTTVETTAHLAHWWDRLAAAVPNPGARCLAITDAGTPLADLAAARGFRACVAAPADVGGRFSVLGPFGLVPAILCGVDVAPVLAGAAAARAGLEAVVAAGKGVAEPSGSSSGASGGPSPDEAVAGLALGAALGSWAAAGADVFAVHAAPPFDAFAMWLEQLVAESLGKGGRGPFLARGVAGPPAAPARCVRIDIGSGAGWGADATDDGSERHVAIRIESAADLGAAIVALEVATATAALVLGVQPFDQPDVEAAKRLARAAVAGEGAAFRPPDARTTRRDIERAVAAWLPGLPPGAAVAIQAYLAPDPEVDAALAALAASIARSAGAGVAVGYGPGYLHSTGQLHKGGPPWVRCVQLVDARLVDAVTDVPIPGGGTFGRLIAAQAAGDAAALDALGRPPFIVTVDDA